MTLCIYVTRRFFFGALWSFVLFLCTLLVWYIWTSFAASDDDALIVDAIVAMEERVELLETTMYTMTEGERLLSGIAAVCGEESMVLAEMMVLVLGAHLTDQFAAYSDADVLWYSWTLYERIQDAHPRVLWLADIDEVCMGKYVLYWVQMRLRTRHIVLLQSSGLIAEMSWQYMDDPHHHAIKVGYLERLSASLSGAHTLLPYTFSFDVISEDVLWEMSPDDVELALLTQDIVIATLYRTLADLLFTGILRMEDIRMLSDRISLTRKQSCEHFHGFYNVVLIYSSDGTKLDTRMDELNITMNVCNNFFILKDIEWYVRQIFTHELGHHVYYFLDPHVDRFEVICRKNEREQHGACDDMDFVSSYAQTLASEDYAETFLFRVLDQVEWESERLSQKLEHFDRLFQDVK